MTSAVCDDIYNQIEQQQQLQCYPMVAPTCPAEPDSDGEDDPGKLLNAWLGQLNKVIHRDLL